ncbi:MAG: DUF4139 domain-containing protein [bacterium]|nr:DUF4139 domain-containing protein [bacterium]MDD5353856.1 DUF4139 domain-containing protein [bacterium]
MHNKAKGLLLLIIMVPGFLGAKEAGIKSTLNDQEALSITIYNSNLGLVKDTRNISLPQGTVDLKFMDVASQINPTTVHIKSLTDPLSLNILEQNYEYDLLSPEKLMEKFVGKTVKIREKNQYTGKEEVYNAKLLSVNNGPIFQVGDEIYAYAPGQVIYPEIPENLIAQPTLVWLLENELAKAQKLEVSYLTGGINWKADYVTVLNKDDNAADVSGWVTIDNKSGATYKDAAIQLVAGDVNRANEPEMRYDKAMSMAGAVARESSFKEESFFEYHLYTLDRKSTIKQNQTKQISLLEAANVPVRKELIFWGAEYYYRSSYGQPISNQKVGVYINVDNKKENRLGMPLPKGIIRVYKADPRGNLQFIGEDRIDHTPKDETIKIKMGEAFDVIGERKQTDFKAVSSTVYEVAWEISLRNHKNADAKVSIIEPVPGDWKILQSSHQAEKVEAHTLKYVVNVPKNGETKVAYRVRIKW